MGDFTKFLLSGSTNGRPIKVTQTATAGDLIHTAVTGTSSFDEIYLYANNTSAASILLTVEWGGVTSPDDLIEFNVPSETGLYCITPGMLLQNGLVVRAFASAANLITMSGFVNRITA